MSKKQRNQRTIGVALNKSQFGSLVYAIDNLAKAVAVAQIRENQSNERKARFLRVFRLTQREIANILGITQSAVSQALKTRQKTREHKGSSKDGAVGGA